MKDRVSLLALRIAAVFEEFSEGEIQKAVKLLEEQGLNSSLLEYLGHRKSGTSDAKKPRSQKPLAEQRSKAVIELEHKDPEKYEVLKEFDSILRKGGVLPGVDDIRKLGDRLSKNFSTRSSRKESISKLMTLLAEKPLSELRDLLKVLLSSGTVAKDDHDYQRLAQFIISGKIPQSTPEQSREVRL